MRPNPSVKATRSGMVPIGKETHMTTDINAPLSVCWQLVSECNYTCGFCYRFQHRKKLDITAAKKGLDRLVQAGVKKVTFSGGEPLLWKPLQQLLEHASAKGVVTSLITNGSLLRDGQIDAFSQVLDWITLPLDGSDERTNVAMGRKSGHTSSALYLIQALSDRGVHVKVNTVVSSINESDIANLAMMIERLPVSRWKLFQFYGVRDDAKDNAKAYRIPLENFSSVCATARKLVSRSTLKIDVAFNSDLEGNYFTILPDADVYVSLNGMDERIGNLLTDTVESMFNDERFDRTRETQRHRWLLTPT